MNVLYPVFGMMALTMFCIARLGILRFNAVKKGEIDPKFFSLFRGYEEPDKLAAYSRHVGNLFETPVLYYVICLTAVATGQLGDVYVVSLAWAYFAVRLMHSYEHLTRNMVLVRFRLFVFSMLVLTALWATVLTGIMRQ